MKNQIKDFVIESEELKDGFSISDVQKYYKRVHNIRPDKRDVIDACLELRKEGVIKNDFENMIMKFV